MSHDYPQWGADQAAPQPPKKKRHLGRNIAIGTVSAVTFFGVLAACTSGSDKPSSAPTQTATSAPKVSPTKSQHAPSSSPPASRAAAKPKPTKTVAEYTVSQQNAIRSAQDYLDLQGFSRAGLLDQLSSKYGEGFGKADAEFAVNHVHADWNTEAVEAAKSYLELGGFSRQGLINQLSSAYGDKFTVAQATYAVNQVGL